MRFKDKDLEKLWDDPHGRISRRLPSDLRKTIYRKLQILDAAVCLDDLRVPPGNHLEALRGSREGHYSIHVNAQWRLCFIWTDTGAEGVEFCGYHK